MRLTVTSWNINSVRLRIDLVLRFLAEAKPDVLCLQETKCPDDAFPLKALRGSGYENVVFAGQKGYNGVAILSRFPLITRDVMSFCERQDARHISAVLGPEAGAAAGIALHDFYVPAGGDVPDTALNPKFAHKLDFLRDLRAWGGRRVQGPAILVGDLNVAPLEHDVWSHKQLLDVVSHTPIETEALELLRNEAGWIDTARLLTPPPEKIFGRGGATGLPTGRPPTRAGASIMPGSRPISPAPCARSTSRGTPAPGSARPTMRP